MNTMELTSTQTMVKMVLDRWYALLKNCDDLFSSLTDEELEKEIAPGRNRGIYLLGHLIAVHDDMMLLLNFGDKLYPALHEPFLKLPDRAIDEIPSAQELRTYWSWHNEILSGKINSMPAEDWFQRHNAVSPEDFTKEPHRNKLNIIITRSSHLAYHFGQLRLLK